MSDVGDDSLTMILLFSRAGRTYLHLGRLKEARHHLTRARQLNAEVPLDSDCKMLSEAEDLLKTWTIYMQRDEFHR